MTIKPLPHDMIAWDATCGAGGSQVIYDNKTGDYYHARCAPDVGDYEEASLSDMRQQVGYGQCRFCGYSIVMHKVPRPPEAPAELNHFL